MTQYHIAIQAAAKLAQETGKKVHFFFNSSPEMQSFDGRLQIGQELDLQVEVKRNLRKSRIEFLRNRLNEKHDWVLIADYLSQPLQQELRANMINYLDLAGNAYLRVGEVFILIEGKKPINLVDQEDAWLKPVETQLVLSFLLQPSLINESYRHLEQLLSTSKTSLSGLFHKLKAEEYLTGSPGNYQLHRCRNLLDQCSAVYGDKVKKRLLLGRFDFVKTIDHSNWKKWQMSTETRWGGEAGGDMLTDNLIPEEWIMYTQGSAQGIIKQYPVKPYSQGPIFVYRQFWPASIEPVTQEKRTVPSVIVYADLVGSGHGRNRQIAEQITLSIC